MNIKINQEQFNNLMEYTGKIYQVGSRLYGTHHELSDNDVVVVTLNNRDTKDGEIYLHKLESAIGNQDTIICNQKTFDTRSKDGSDVLLFEAYHSKKGMDFNIAKMVRAYSGIAYRDLKESQREGKTKEYSDRKFYHAVRSQFIAEDLISNGMVNFKDIAKEAIFFLNIEPSIKEISERINRLRTILKNAQ